ncbi:MAG: chromosome partitioning protein ParB, partial [Acidobacteriota bacterium]|nr:chromosome partitioning protein ParB [Acidobacteriota bacterium]
MNKNDSPRRALGKGLNSLLPTRTPRAEEPSPPPETSVTHLPVEDIQPNPNQPRSHFEDARLEELAR